LKSAVAQANFQIFQGGTKNPEQAGHGRDDYGNVLKATMSEHPT